MTPQDTRPGSVTGRLDFRHIPCPVCGCDAYAPVGVGEAFDRAGAASFLVVRCARCGLLYLNPRPVGAASGGANGGRRRFGPRGGRWLERSAGMANGGRTLVVGPDVAAADLARFPAVSFVEELEKGRVEGSYATVVLAGSLEAVPDPAATLALARTHLAPDGTIVVLGGNVESPSFRLFRGRHWDAYGFPRRLQFFPPSTLERLAARVGLVVESRSTLADSAAWSGSLHNLFVDWRGANGENGEADATGPILRVVAFAIEGACRALGRGVVQVVRLRVAERAGPSRPSPARRQGRTSAAPIVVLGAGIAGLTAASELKRRSLPVVVYEAGKRIAGLAGSFRDADGFTYDFGAHFITNRFAAALGVGARCRTVERFGEAVLYDGRVYGYPFGLLRSPRWFTSAAWQRLRRVSSPAPRSAAEWYRLNYGRRLAEDVAIPLVEAWSGAPAEDLAPSVIPPQLDRGIGNVLKLKIAGRLSDRAVANGFSREQPESPNVFHVYPVDGMGVLTGSLAEGLEPVIEVESPVQAIYVEDERVVGVRVGDRDRDARCVLSTAPIHVLPKLVRGTTRLDRFARFRYRPMVLVNLRFDARPVLPEVCTWTPEADTPFFRLTESTLAMPWLAPTGKTIVTADIGCEVRDAMWAMEDEAVGELCRTHLERLFPAARGRYLGCHVLRTPVAYPVYLREYEDERRELEGGLPVEGLYTIGRNGEFAHVLMEDVYWRTLNRTESIAADLDDRVEV